VRKQKKRKRSKSVLPETQWPAYIELVDRANQVTVTVDVAGSVTVIDNTEDPPHEFKLSEHLVQELLMRLLDTKGKDKVLACQQVGEATQLADHVVLKVFMRMRAIWDNLSK